MEATAVLKEEAVRGFLEFCVCLVRAGLFCKGSVDGSVRIQGFGLQGRRALCLGFFCLGCWVQGQGRGLLQFKNLLLLAALVHWVLFCLKAHGCNVCHVSS